MNSPSSRRPCFVARASALAAALAVISPLTVGGCSSDSPARSTGGDGGGSGTCTGGPVTGAADSHCASKTQTVGICRTGAYDAGTQTDAGVEPPAPVLYGTEGDDDDCKYHVVLDVPALCRNQQASIKLTMTNKKDGKPVTGAHPAVEATIGTAAGPIADDSTETGNGVYEVPVLLDRKGRWEVRFHFFEECADTQDSPHGHVGFFFDVP